MKTFSAMMIALLALSVTSVRGIDYYVSASGNDSNSGTSSSAPWKSLSKVEGMMSTFTSKANNENVTVYFNNADSWSYSDRFDITCTGTAAHPITFDGTTWGGNAAGSSKAALQRASTSGYEMVRLKYGNGTSSPDIYVVLKGFDINGNHMQQSIPLLIENPSSVTILDNKIHDVDYNSGWIPGIRFTTTANTGGTMTIGNFVVEGNEIYGTGVHGIAFYPATGTENDHTGPNLDNVANITVNNNIIHSYGNCSSTTYGGGIQVMSCAGGIISGNTIYDSAGNDGFGIKLEDRQRACSDIDVCNNYIHGGPGIELYVGIAVDGGQNIDIYNNVIQDVAAQGIIFGAPDASTGNIYNNTVSGTGSTAVRVSSASTVYILENNVNGATLPSEDTEAPTTPASLAATATSETSINLSWSASTDNTGVTEYRIYRGGSYLAAAVSTSYSDSGLTAGTTYTYTVSARDAAGNESTQSQSASATTASVQPDTQAPTTPANLTASTVSSTQIDLAWSASSDNTGVSDYRIYRNGTYLTTTTTTSYSDAGLTESTTYAYTVSARDAAGNESSQSQAASATTLSSSDIISSAQWQNKSFTSQSGQFTVEYDAIPSGSSIDGVTGLSLGDATGYSDCAVTIRFSLDGIIDARGSIAYSSDVQMAYTAGTSYHFRIVVDVQTHTYSVYVTEAGGSETLLAQDYGFRSGQETVASLDTLATVASQGSHQVLNFNVASTAVPKAPEGQPMIINFQL